MFPAKQMVLSHDGSKSTAETLPCLVALSPCLNLIQNLGDEFERGIWKLDPIPSNLKELEIAVHWMNSQISHTIYRQLIEFMPRTIHAVFRAKDGPVLY
ncbi:hypothetical protein TNCV_1664711 [Trichonephila clavipes]|uniref:Uncharacterized protein n=1 Tax=Trichonephila clavipes TaxID=2585209 RepID=A0A8X6RZX9_TRICX|nr:hypothetical protein TNCV_1664711 [Trichonephila clavipes]